MGEAAAGGGHFPREAPSARSMAGRKKGDRQKLGMDVCWVLQTTGSPRRMLCSGLPEVSVPAGASAGSAEGCLGAAPLRLAARSCPLAVLTRATWTLSSCKYIYCTTFLIRVSTDVWSSSTLIISQKKGHFKSYSIRSHSQVCNTNQMWTPRNICGDCYKAEIQCTCSWCTVSITDCTNRKQFPKMQTDEQRIHIAHSLQSQPNWCCQRGTASSFSRSSNCIFWCDACGKQSSALFSTSEIYHWSDIDLMEESPEGNTIKLDFNWKCRKRLLLLKSHHNQWRHFLNTMGGNPLLPFSPVSGHRSLFSSRTFLPPSDTSLLLSAPGYAGRARRALAPIVKVQKVLCQGAAGTPVPPRPRSSRALPLKKKGTPGCLFRHLPQTSGI